MASVPQKGFAISDSFYKKIKILVMIIFPVFSTIYFIVGSIFGWANLPQVLGFIAVITTFLSVVLVISARFYNKSDSRFDGSIDIHTTEADVKVYSLNLNSDPEDLDSKSSILFKVNRN